MILRVISGLDETPLTSKLSSDSSSSSPSSSYSSTMMKSFHESTSQSPSAVAIREPSLRSSFRHVQRAIADHSRRDYEFNVGDEAAARRCVQLWHIIVGLLAFLDCIANLIGHIFDTDETADGTFWKWLYLKRKTFSNCFSLVWMVDLILVAKYVRIPRCERLSKEGVRRMRLDDAQDAIRDCTGNMGSTFGIYLRVVSFQLLVLPISIYVQMYRFAFGPFTQHLELTAAAPKFREACVDSFQSDTQKSILMALLACYVSRASRTSKALKTSGKTHLNAFALRKVLSNIHRPRKLWRQIQNLLRLLRWGMYLSTLLGPFGNLMDHFSAFRKRYAQQREATAAMKERKRRRSCLNPTEAEEHCARIVQASYRAKRARQSIRALRIFQQDQEHVAALKFQRALKASLRRSRCRLKEQHDRLHEFRKHQQKVLRQERRTMSLHEQRYLYQMEKELTEEVRSIHVAL